MFPVHLLSDPDEQLPEDSNGLSYVVGSNGIFRRVETPVFRATLRTDGVPHLAEVQEGMEYLLPRIPSVVAMRMIRFFRLVHLAHGTEAMAFIAFNPDACEFRVEMRPQRVRDMQCEFGPQFNPDDGFVLVGTAHSHADGRVFTSQQDFIVNSGYDGLHLTFGTFGTSVVDAMAVLAVDRRLVPLPLEKVFAGLTATQSLERYIPQRVPRWVRSAADFAQRLADAIRTVGRPVERMREGGPKGSGKDYFLELPPRADPSSADPDPKWLGLVTLGK